ASSAAWAGSTVAAKAAARIKLTGGLDGQARGRADRAARKGDFMGGSGGVASRTARAKGRPVGPSSQTKEVWRVGYCL
ncbi:hypothetical protein, partial [Priestia megaterium]|uniref:hypothetical protein n=1 Tax=Priestia megaterium TaxID=1404 RepID=UPI0035B68994